MNQSTTKIRCVTKNCKNFNPIETKFCHQCSTPIVKKYLFIQGKLSKKYKVGELINNRFLLCYPQTVLDLKPDIILNTPEVIPEEIKVYLKLFAHRLHIPQVYGYLDFPEHAWLFEYESVPLNSEGKLIFPQFFPGIESCLSKVSALRQMNWLWQIVNLWTPLSQRKALSSFFIINNIRVDSSIVKLLKLQLDEDCTPTLQDLGNLWMDWLALFDPLVQDILKKIILSLQQNLFTNIDEVLQILDQIIYILGNNYYQRKYQVITATDTGKKKVNNEDACYPPVNKLKKVQRGCETLSVICDGLGGQDAGEVASSLAVKIINQTINDNYRYTDKKTLDKKHWTPLVDIENIYKAISEANNQITKLNNAEKRSKTKKMATTATMAMALAHELYLANVGDSRTYWITLNSCHQVSIDDDIATRTVKRGKELYRSISATPKGGILLQALGIEFSHKLKIHLKRLTLDEDSVFLLCSDGLSDLDRVEQYWYSEVRPLIQNKRNLEDVAKNLMDIGINKNGHDNISLALLFCEVKQRNKVERSEELSWKYLRTAIPNLPNPKEMKIQILSSTWMISLNTIIFTVILLVFGVSLGLWCWNQHNSSDNKQSSNIDRLLNLEPN